MPTSGVLYLRNQFVVIWPQQTKRQFLRYDLLNQDLTKANQTSTFMIKIAQEGRVRMIVKTSMESPQIIVTDGDDLKVFFHIFGW